MSSTGLFLVCFESTNLKAALARNEYYSRVGTYLDLVNQTAAVAGIKPKIMLVATKVEDPEECQESLDKVLSMAKAQLTSVSSESFLVDSILQTSSKVASKDTFLDMYGKIYALCTAEEVRSRPKETIPTFWYRLLAALKEMPHTTVDQVIEMLEKIKAEETGPATIPKELLDSLEKLREVMMYLTAVNDAKLAVAASELKNAKDKTTPTEADHETRSPAVPTTIMDNTEEQPSVRQKERQKAKGKVESRNQR